MTRRWPASVAWLAVVLVAAGAGMAAAQDAAYIRQHYTKFEHRIPMRDGVRLFTVVYVPKDKSKAYPIILRRTPYSVAPYGIDSYQDKPDNQRARFFQEGYIVAYQDVRGRMMSEGEFVNVRPYVPNKKSPRDIDETTDTYDTVEWLVKNVPGNNGRVGISGVSWSHGQWGSSDGSRLGEIGWGSKTADYYTEHIELPFFNEHLKQQGQASLAEAMVFETGANEWQRMEAWPPNAASPREIYLRTDGAAAFGSPADAGAGGSSYREYVSDPAHPVPYTAEIRHWYNPAFMVEDQRFAARRPDVLVYQTGPLEEDPRVAGPIKATLFVSTTGTDSDWVVKVIDVFPDDTKNPDPNPRNVQMGGYQMLVRGEVIRGKFRKSLAAPEPFVPGAVTKVEFDLQDVFHRFKKGHRLMVQVQSSWFPKVDVNPQTFVDIYAARQENFQRATQRVYGAGAEASRLTLLVLP